MPYFYNRVQNQNNIIRKQIINHQIYRILLKHKKLSLILTKILTLSKLLIKFYSRTNEIETVEPNFQ